MQAADDVIDEADILDRLGQLLDTEQADAASIAELLMPLDARETARVVCELPIEQQAELLRRLSPEAAVEVLDTLPEVTVVEAVEELPAEVAAAIVHELASDDQADLIGAMDTEAAAAVLAELDDDEAQRIAELASYPEDCAGGLMATEVVALRDIATVQSTLGRLRAGASRLRDLDVQYAYVVAKGRRLVGVLRLRDLLIADEGARLSEIMIADPLSIPAEMPLEELTAFFDDHAFIGAPVVDDQGRLLGAVSRRAVDVAQAQVSAARAQRDANADSGTDVAQAQAQLALASAARRSAQVRLKETDIAAPAKGKVLSRSVEPGQIVQPGRALLTLALSGPLQLVAQVDERYLEQLSPGQPAQVLADAYPAQAFQARVLSIAPVVDSQRGAIEVKFSLPAAAPDFLREDMTVSIEVETARREQALVVPVSALRSEANAEPTVWVERDGRVEERRVRLGLRTLAWAEVLEGLNEGDAVLFGPAPGPGARVRAVAGAPVASAQAPAREDAGAVMTNAVGR